MSNLPWSEKYRPRTLADVKGNPHAVTQLRAWGSAWARGIPAPVSYTHLTLPTKA